MKNTKKHEPSLKLYTVLLRLYPEHFRKKYEEQLLLTAADILTNSNSTGAVALATIRLYADTISNALHVRLTHTNTLRPQLRGTTPRSALRSFLFAVQLFAIVIVSLLWLVQFNSAIRSIISYAQNDYMTIITVVAESLILLTLITYLPLAVVLVRRHAKLSLWKAVSWGYTLGVAGTVGAGLFGAAAYRVFIPTSSLSDLLILGPYTALFFIAVTRIAKRLARPQLSVSS